MNSQEIIDDRKRLLNDKKQKEEEIATMRVSLAEEEARCREKQRVITRQLELVIGLDEEIAMYDKVLQILQKPAVTTAEAE